MISFRPFLLLEQLFGFLSPYPFWIKDLGKKGEYLAKRHYRRKGFFLLAQNWTSYQSNGELDLVMSNAKIVVFIEVKTRTTLRDTLLIHEHLTREQTQRINRLAIDFLYRYPKGQVSWELQAALINFSKKKKGFTIKTYRLDHHF